ncbi:MAG: serine endoprotease DegQ [Acidiferrobacteraceae bacterium]|nr:serine endoprotease DegQ [Acidiferrobacteraceae bacterium]|tara:strand:+ start:3737 stop:5113 length:1377 start_codon:yes stop_codon:yes gene_type:complete
MKTLASFLRHRISISIIAIYISGFVAISAASLPATVDGQPLPTLAPMIERVLPSVVNIATTGRIQVQQNPLSRDPLFRDFFNFPDIEPRERRTNNLGSGVIVDGDEGYVVTNNHVIENADQINVRLHDGRVFEAELVGADPEADIAVIRIPAEDLYGIAIGDSEILRVGDFVVAIGNPFGLGQTVTSGIVSAKGRSGLGIEGYEDFIQTDASINSGNSGGALVNLNGELVGINTAIYSGRGGGNVGIGFAIPVQMAMRLASQIVEYGEVRRGRLGVIVQDVTPELREAMEISVSSGALISQVLPDSAAAAAGLIEGDVIINVNGRAIAGASDLRNVIGLSRAGETVQIEYLRNGELLVKSVEIRAAETEISFDSSSSKYLEGATLGNAEQGKAGVVVIKIEPGSRASKSELREGDLILSINRMKVDNISQVEAVVAQSSRGLLLQIRRGQSVLFLVLR